VVEEGIRGLASSSFEFLFPQTALQHGKRHAYQHGTAPQNTSQPTQKHHTETKIALRAQTEKPNFYSEKISCTSYYLYSCLEDAVTNLIFGVGISLQT
jgi:hypothetical protein